ncbi:copper homeostasis protein CutC [Listeria fleischmannii]|uniref:PF03932 family protein CutC n=1 Tax=Listeria fleischmannii TaxID=1069827 RepID=A0A841YDW8_9LIST|nr:copper homeostasis protein CutC [Listeria fleischmannii]EIA19967.1 hypothetical protein KKC_09587 [Listeria fleischmannii subsp. coloradonensis]MBC1398420.1 copper homeostasis protein CutC [Listeria fleischmannii]MBC1418719.1 copper homeostasis protein CutC [Listeria fleischmannii]MBC1426481.1 copper homeostasis protein CutC [Listeria fleischmannii]STY46605.1 CutC-like protein M6_Spy0363 [Listeria fleischmannii subsp. coloradonensis]
MVIKELCIENHDSLERAIRNGAKRVELCDNLAKGGTSVSIGVAEFVQKKASETGVSVVAMLRPRAGNFCYSDAEISMMRRDLEAYQSVGIKAFVFGCLTETGELNKTQIKELMHEIDAEFTFHMAFDELKTDKKIAIDWLAENGFTRILTHGGAGHLPPEEVIPVWREYIQYANHRITILPGGGITSENWHEVAQKTGATELHGTKIV